MPRRKGNSLHQKQDEPSLKKVKSSKSDEFTPTDCIVHPVQWGPFLSERQWGTVREDLSPDGNCWDFTSYKSASHTAYINGEDGLLGFSDNNVILCGCLALWNGKDRCLKERMFGLTGGAKAEGNHGEDVKECYYYLDGTPDHKYSKALYKYPQNEFPYEQLIKENASRGKLDDEYELLDTGIFRKSEYWDVEVEYAKQSDNLFVMRYTVYNRSSQAATLHVLQNLWFRNTWSFEKNDENEIPEIKKTCSNKASCTHPILGEYVFEALPLMEMDEPQLLFTNNDTRKDGGGIWDKNQRGSSTYAKDAFHHYVINGDAAAVCPENKGTKCGALYKCNVERNSSVIIDCCLKRQPEGEEKMTSSRVTTIINTAKKEADRFYENLLPRNLTLCEYKVARAAYAGLCWSKQLYKYDVAAMLAATEGGFQWNKSWQTAKPNHLIAVCDTWEFPWFATWDTCFQMVVYAEMDPQFAKNQLMLFLRDDYMLPSGQIPGCEFDLSDPNPPLHAWAILKVFKEEARQMGKKDFTFLEESLKKLEKNHSWWKENKSCSLNYLFTGGFLGLDNISCLDRSMPPVNWQIRQVDATSWVALMSLNLAEIAIELANHSYATNKQFGLKLYSDKALQYLKFFNDIYLTINSCNENIGLWDEEDGIYYDQIVPTKSSMEQTQIKLKVQSLVGLSPLVASSYISEEDVRNLPRVKAYLQSMQICKEENKGYGYHLSLVNQSKFDKLMKHVFNKDEFLSTYGIRALSKLHLNDPCVLQFAGKSYSANYWPGESQSDMYGGNSNWRGTIWFCMNYILLEAIEKRVSWKPDLCISKHICETYKGLTSIFFPDENGDRPCHAKSSLYREDSNFKDLVLFYEYFHGDTGRGCGASHQTGWTALAATLLRKVAAKRLL